MQEVAGLIPSGVSFFDHMKKIELSGNSLGQGTYYSELLRDLILAAIKDFCVFKYLAPCGES